MKSKTHGPRPRSFLVGVLAFALALATGAGQAQEATVLYEFSPTDRPEPNLDGAHPLAGLVLSGQTLYGTTYVGGESRVGTVFALNPDGSNFRVLHTFAGIGAPFSISTLLPASGSLYGTFPLPAENAAQGAIFAVNTEGSDFRLVHAFQEVGGSFPDCELILDGETIYGTTSRSDESHGTVFAMRINGEDFRTLHTFAGFENPLAQTNLDGSYPRVGLTLEGTVLYGATSGGGKNGAGTIFKLNTDGSEFAVLHHFARITGAPPSAANADGSGVSGRMILTNGVLYGATRRGGPSDNGVVFAIQTNGSNFRLLRRFPTVGSGKEAAEPGPLTLAGDALIGASQNGGAFREGTLFRLSLDGAVYQTLHSFSTLSPLLVNREGAKPFGVADNALFYTTVNGGTFGTGVIGRFDLAASPPSLEIQKTQEGVRILIYGEVGRTYVLEESSILPAVNWAPKLNVPVTAVPQPVDLPAPSSPAFWRARVF